MSFEVQGQDLIAKATIFAVLLIGFILALYLGVSVSDGDYFPVLVLLIVISGLAWVLVAESSYWVVLPLAFSLSLPALPFGGKSFEIPELVSAACFAVFLARLAMGKQNFNPLRIEYLFVTAYVAWVAYIYMRNPSGLLIFGSSSGGARFYFKLALAYFSFVVISNQILDERKSRFIVFSILIASLISLAWTIYTTLKYGGGVESNFGEESFYTWHQYVAIPAMIGITYLLGRYSFDQIFSLRYFYLIPSFLLGYLVILQSGKRAMFAGVLITSFFVSIIRGKWIIAFVGALFAFLIVGGLVAGHRQYFELPHRVQRVLVNLPGEWDKEVRAQVGGGEAGWDSFRTRINEKAIEQISQSPWIGPGFQINIEEFNRIMVVQGTGAGEDEMILEMLAKGSSWHNMWLGTAADFGIPASVIYGLFYLQVVWLCVHLWRRIKFGSYRHTLLVMTGLYFFYQILVSWTGGHSVMTPYEQWWHFGLLVAFYYSLKNEKKGEVSDTSVVTK
jgi:O-antigen ligase